MEEHHELRRASDARIGKMEGQLESLAEAVGQIAEQVREMARGRPTQWGPVISGFGVLAAFTAIVVGGYARDMARIEATGIREAIRLEAALVKVGEHLEEHTGDGHPNYIKEKIETVRALTERNQTDLASLRNRVNSHGEKDAADMARLEERVRWLVPGDRRGGDR